MEYAVSVIKNVLGALYQTGGASLIIAALFMSVYMRIKKKRNRGSDSGMDQ